MAILPLVVIFIISSVLLSILMIVAFGDRWYNSLSTSYYDTKTNVKIIGSLKFQYVNHNRINEYYLMKSEVYIMGSLELTFRYTQSEYVKAERQYLFASKTITKTSVVILALYLPASLIYLFFSAFSTLSIAAFAVAAITAVIGYTLYFYLPAYKFKQTAKYHEEYSLTFSNTGIKFKTPSINSELKWNIYSAFWESCDFYFLIQAPRMYTLIPKRVLESPAARQTFEDIVRANMNGSKRIV